MDEDKYRKLKCPKCGQTVWRYITKHPLDMIYGLNDGRLGNAHTHTCFTEMILRGYVLYSDPKRKKLIHRDWEQRWPEGKEL